MNPQKKNLILSFKINIHQSCHSMNMNNDRLICSAFITQVQAFITQMQAFTTLFQLQNSNTVSSLIYQINFIKIFYV